MFNKRKTHREAHREVKDGSCTISNGNVKRFGFFGTWRKS